jgi:putative transposase
LPCTAGDLQPSTKVREIAAMLKAIHVTNNPLERILREIRRRTRVVGAFPDGQSALNLAAARLRYIAGTAWSTKRYLNIELLKDQQMRGAITA